MASLENAAVILRLMSALNRKVTVTDLVEQLGLPKSSASRLLAQMREHGLIERDESTRAYGPGLMILELSHLVRSTTTLASQMETALKRLGTKSGHTGYLSVLDGNDVLVLHVQQGKHPLRVTTYPGHRLPCWATSTGRVLLAREGDKQVVQRLGKTLPFIAKGIPVKTSDLLLQLADIRARGFAVAVNEAIPGVASVSCAISDPASNERFAMCQSFAAAEASEQVIAALASDLVEQAQRLGRAIGDPAWCELA